MTLNRLDISYSLKVRTVNADSYLGCRNVICDMCGLMLMCFDELDAKVFTKAFQECCNITLNKHLRESPECFRLILNRPEFEERKQATS